MKKNTMRMWLVAVCALGAAAASARATTNVYLVFQGGTGALTAAQKATIKANLEAKYAFEPNIHFIIGNPPTGNDFFITFWNGSSTTDDYGQAAGVGSGRGAYVYGGRLTGPQLRSHFIDPMHPEKQTNALSDIAAHELGHLLGCEHNCHAPMTADVSSTGVGRDLVRTPGDGMLVGGRPGLMADGHKVTPDELAADSLGFTGGEQMIIRKNIAKLKAGETITPSGTTPIGSLNPEFIQGARFNLDDPNPQPPWANPYPIPPLCQWVNFNIQISGAPGYDFGYATADGGFVPQVFDGETPMVGAFRARAVADLAFRQVNAPDNTRRTLAQNGQTLQLGQPVPGSFSRSPVVTGQYYRSAMFAIDHDGLPQTQPAIVSIQFGGFDYYDGLRMVPYTHPCPTDLDGDHAATVGDIFILLAWWFANDPRADWDVNAAFEIVDIFAYLARWFVPC